MDILKISEGRIALIKHKAVIKEQYKLQDESIERTKYLTDSEWKEWSEQQIPKHARYELINHEDIDVSDYAWCEGIDLSNETDPISKANEMVKYKSLAEYNASLPESQMQYQIDLDYRLSKMELGI